jgi:hypothetical protein
MLCGYVCVVASDIEKNAKLLMEASPGKETLYMEDLG